MPKKSGVLHGTPDFLFALTDCVEKELRGKIRKKIKSKARLASPQSRPTSPVNGAGGITGCSNDSDHPGSFRSVQIFLHTVK